MIVRRYANWEHLSNLIFASTRKLYYNKRKEEIAMNFTNELENKNNKGIYAILNTANSFIYVGQTRQRFIKRFWHHQWKLRNGTHDNNHLQNAWNLYGEDSFEFFVIENVKNNDNLNHLEEKYIQLYRGNNCCYNIQDGGQTAHRYTRTKEHRKLIGEKNRVNMTGKKHSKETKRKMSESRKGQHYNEESYSITKEQAFSIKTSLVEGMKPSHIAESMNISYKIVNGILSNNTWSRVIVEGWDSFRTNRQKTSRFTIDECIEVYSLYLTKGYTQKDLATMYNKSRHTIANAINRAQKAVEGK